MDPSIVNISGTVINLSFWARKPWLSNDSKAASNVNKSTEKKIKQNC